MRNLMSICAIFLALTGCTTQKTTGTATAPPNPRLAERRHEIADPAYDAKLRILSDALTARIRPVKQSLITAEAKDNVACREVRVTDPAQDTSSHFMQNEVSLGMNGGEIVVAYNDDNGLPKTVSGFGWSADGGQTFTDGGDMLPPGQAFGGGDPLVLADPNDPSRFLYIELTYGGTPASSMLLHESTDGGHTFPPEQALDMLKGLKGPNGKPLNGPAYFHDKEWASWYAPTNTLVLAWSLFQGNSSMPAAITSHDGGRTWSDPVSLMTSGQMGGLCGDAVGPNGELYVVWNEYYSSTLRVSRSLNGGTTWEGPFMAVPTFQAPFNKAATQSCQQTTALNGNIRTATIPSLAVDPVNGNLYLVYNYKSDKNAGDDSDIGFVMSSDRGATWTEPIRLNDDTTTTDQFQPWVATTGNGNIFVMFYDRRDDPANSNIHVYAAQSLDGGATWLANRRITCTSFPPAADAACYMGDYNQVVTDGSVYVLAWGDNRNTLGDSGKPNPDIYSVRIGAVPRIRPVARP